MWDEFAESLLMEGFLNVGRLLWKYGVQLGLGSQEIGELIQLIETLKRKHTSPQEGYLTSDDPILGLVAKFRKLKLLEVTTETGEYKEHIRVSFQPFLMRIKECWIEESPQRHETVQKNRLQAKKKEQELILLKQKTLAAQEKLTRKEQELFNLEGCLMERETEIKEKEEEILAIQEYWQRILKNKNTPAPPSSKGLLSKVEQLKGTPLSPREIQLVEEWSQWLWEDDMILHFIANLLRLKMRQANQWARIAQRAKTYGAENVTELDEFLSAYNYSYEKVYEVLRQLGSRSLVTDAFVDSYEKWQTTWGLSHEVIVKGAQIAAKQTTNPTFNYLEAILREWSKQGVKTLEDADEAFARHLASKQKKDPAKRIERITPNLTNQYIYGSGKNKYSNLAENK